MAVHCAHKGVRTHMPSGFRRAPHYSHMHPLRNSRVKKPCQRFCPQPLRNLGKHCALGFQTPRARAGSCSAARAGPAEGPRALRAYVSAHRCAWLRVAHRSRDHIIAHRLWTIPGAFDIYILRFPRLTTQNLRQNLHYLRRTTTNFHPTRPTTCSPSTAAWGASEDLFGAAPRRMAR